MYDEDQIKRIKDTSNSSTAPIVQAGVIDALKEHGKQAIEAINEVVNSPVIDKQIKVHGLKVIKELSEIDEIRRIQETGIHLADSKEKIEVIDSLAGYGNKAIVPILDIMGSSVDQRVKTYGYKTIQMIKTYLIIRPLPI